MGKLGLAKLAYILFAVCGAAVIASPAQSFRTLVDVGSPDAPGLIQAADGNFYGTTLDGGANGGGTVFQMTPAGTLTTLYSFCSQTNCTDGSAPSGLVQATDGNFYGATLTGGTGGRTSYPCAAGCGTLFKITPAGILTTLYSFCSQTNCTDGSRPSGLVQATDGNFYGTTLYGGTGGRISYPCILAGCGTVFKMTSAATLTTLYSFCSQTNCTDGSLPIGGLVQATDGNFYGTTAVGGTGANGGTYPCGGNCGTIFEMTPAGKLTTLHSFDSTEGHGPSVLVQATDGNFYGTTLSGGTKDNGTVFQMTPAGTLTTLHSFCSLSNCSDGATPGALVQATNGNFYGITLLGGVGKFCGSLDLEPALGCGTVFEITSGGALFTLYELCSQPNCTDGYRPAGLLQAADRIFYGTTQQAGIPSVGGTIFTFGGPIVTLSSTSLGFVHALDETTAPQIVTLTNSGGDLLTITGMTISDNFAISANTCLGATLLPGKKCKLSVTFTPTLVGKLTGALLFTDDAANSPQRLTLIGAGVEPAMLLPVCANYGAQAVGTTSAAKSFIVTNNQTVTLANLAITSAGDFAVSATTCTTSLAGRGKCTINVTFTPMQTGTRTGQLIVSDSASNSPQTVPLSGVGLEPATLTPASAAYGAQAVGAASAAKTFIVTNNQTVTLANLAISMTGDFAISATTCTTSLAAKGKCTISVTFTPTQTGPRTGELSVSDSASNSPQTSSLKGTGT